MIYRHNSTIGIRLKECKSCGKLKPIFSRGRCAECSKIEDTHAKISAAQHDEDGLPELISRLDKLVSKWVRYSAKTKMGVVECFTCEDFFLPENIDAGHYISRSCMYLRFDAARNIRPQCIPCNRHKYGQAAAFGKRLETEHPGITELLLEESRIIYKYSRDELINLINEYTQKLKQLNIK